MTDYPPSLPERNQTAPVPRRIRGTVDGHTVVDTTSALYVWEWANYPQYYIPLSDVNGEFLIDEEHPQRLRTPRHRRHQCDPFGGLQV